MDLHRVVPSCLLIVIWASQMRWCSHTATKWPRAHSRRKPLWQRGLTVHGVSLDVVLLTHQKILPPELSRRREPLNHKGFRRRLSFSCWFWSPRWGETFHPGLPRLHLLFSGRTHGHWPRRCPHTGESGGPSSAATDREYTDRLQLGDLRPELLFPADPETAGRLARHPALLWKAQNARWHRGGS
jgi:hypothetical protein